MGPKKRSSYSAPGYSLPEVLMALAIGSALMVMALPNMFELYHRYTLWTAAYELANELQNARMMAVAANTSIGLRCDARTGAYQLIEATGAPVAVEHYLPRGVRFEHLPRTPLWFHSRGTAAPAGTFTLAEVIGRARVIVSVAGRIRMEIDREPP